MGDRSGDSSGNGGGNGSNRWCGWFRRCRGGGSGNYGLECRCGLKGPRPELLGNGPLVRVYPAGSVAEHTDDAGRDQHPGQVDGFGPGEPRSTRDVVDGATRCHFAAEDTDLGDVHVGGKFGSGVFEDESAGVAFRAEHLRGPHVAGVAEVQCLRERCHAERHRAQRRCGRTLVHLDFHFGKFHHGGEGGQ